MNVIKKICLTLIIICSSVINALVIVHNNTDIDIPMNARCDVGGGDSGRIVIARKTEFSYACSGGSGGLVLDFETGENKIYVARSDQGHYHVALENDGKVYSGTNWLGNWDDNRAYGRTQSLVPTRTIKK